MHSAHSTWNFCMLNLMVRIVTVRLYKVETNFMENSPLKADGPSFYQEILSILRHPTFHHCVHTRQPMQPIVRQTNPHHILLHLRFS